MLLMFPPIFVTDTKILHGYNFVALGRLPVLFKDITVLVQAVFKLRNIIASLIDCLHASTVVPDFAPQPLRYKPGEEQLSFVNGAKMEL